MEGSFGDQKREILHIFVNVSVTLTHFLSMQGSLWHTWTEMSGIYGLSQYSLKRAEAISSGSLMLLLGHYLVEMSSP